MRRVVAGFTHREGIHCGSTAMADALNQIGIELSEPMALGLGAGPAFALFDAPGLSPSRFFLGRSASFEHDLATRLGVGFDELSIDGFDHAWRTMRDFIDADRPVLALTDLRYLPHYHSRTHFNGHRVVLAGYDDDDALVADTHFPGLVPVPLAEWNRALTSDAAPLVTTDCVFGVLDPPASKPDLNRLVPEAIRANAEEMLAPSETSGVPGIEALASSLRSWADVSDAAWCARFAYQVIEKRGCGGGLFRRLYASFLAESNRPGLGQLAVGAADAWTRLATELQAASESASPKFDRAAAIAREVATAERGLWEAAKALA